RLAHLDRRSGGAHQGKISAVTGPHAEGGTGTGHRCARLRRRGRVIVEGISEETRLRRRGLALLLLRAAEKEIEQTFGRDGVGGKREGARDRNRNDNSGAAPHARKTRTVTQRLLHPTLPTGPKKSDPGEGVRLSS